jgi:predicted RNA methylase
VGLHRVTVSPLPNWLDSGRLLELTSADWEREELGDDLASWSAKLESSEAATLAARLRGLGFAGWPLSMQVDPPLDRAMVREARLSDARRRRGSFAGFSRPRARWDEEGRYSLTSEPLALELGRRAAATGEFATVLDAGCGVGGNTIGFARAGLHVTAVERSRERLEMARHNAAVYEVSEQVHFANDDALTKISEGGHDLLFIDPPWGGEEFDRRRFDLRGLELLESALESAAMYREVWAKLPPSADLRELSRRADYRDPWAVFGAGERDRDRVKFLIARFRRAEHAR